MKPHRPFVIGLTGSVGMGKSTTAKMFEKHGAAVWDADAAVARLYSKDGAGVRAIRLIRPDAIQNDAVDKTALKEWIADDPTALAQIELAIHPLVSADQTEFLATTDAEIVVLDVPLLFETGLESSVDITVVATAPSEIQRKRVLARPGMTEAQFELILAKQLDDKIKRARADFIVPTDTFKIAENAVEKIMDHAKGTLKHA